MHVVKRSGPLESRFRIRGYLWSFTKYGLILCSTSGKAIVLLGL